MKLFCQSVFLLLLLSSSGFAFEEELRPFLEDHCYDCHADGMDKGGLDFDKLGSNLSDPATFAKWEMVFDRVRKGEMPPEKVKTRPSSEGKAELGKVLGESLNRSHLASKGAVLRRLNRREYQNTLNDLFGTSLDLEGLLPEDGRSHEFDNVGEALGISMTHLERYLEGARLVFDASVAKWTQPPAAKLIPGNFRDSEIEKALGKTFKKLDDGAIVRFQGGGYPSGLLRNSGAPESGWYQVKVRGYAYQSDKAIVCSIGGESYAHGSKKPIYKYVSFSPGKATTVEFKIYIEKHSMLVVEPQGIALPQPRPKILNEYEGPGFAFVSASIEGPLYGDYPSRGHKLVFDGLKRQEIEPRDPETKKKEWYKPKFEIITTDERADVLLSIKRVAAFAWRRPVSDADLESYLKLFENERAQDASFEEALRTAVTALFVSPNFLYLRETPGRLDDLAVVNRLAYFLTRTAPDKQLLSLATQKKMIKDDKVMIAQAERLMKGPHFDRFITDFTEAWLNLREIDFTAPDKTLFPEFDPYLRYSLPLETEAFLRELIISNLPVTNVVKSEFAMLNSRLAEHYGLPQLTGSQIRRVKLPTGSIRGGFLTQASVLKVSANGTNTSPVLRGVWVMERILGDPPSPPPPGISGVEPDIRGAETLRQILDQHRDSTSCAACHKKIDPPGFALESFNPIGGFRERFRSLGNGDKVDTIIKGRRVGYRLGPDVDCSGNLADGRKFSSLEQFRDYLAEDEAVLARSFATKLLTFATGREMGFSDRPEITRIVKQAGSKGYRVRDLFHLVVTSEIFLTK
ncbi:MAG: DUF1588 domain-containing protein [Verrucomicrobiota bacterium]